MIVACALLALSACASAPPEEELGGWKYPRQNISEAEWKALKAETVQLQGAKVEESEISTKVTIEGASKQLHDRVVYMFTTPQHSGHPAAAKVTFPLNAKGQATPDFAFHYAGSKEGFRAFVNGVIIGGSLMAVEPPK